VSWNLAVDRYFTVEDVPPKSVGGRPLLLTCGGCNWSAGQEVDWHWTNFTDVEGFATGHLPEAVTVNFKYEGLKVVAEVSNDGSGYLIKIIEKASNPAMLKQLQDLVSATIGAGGQPQDMKLGFYKSAYHERLVKLSVMRAAYLTGIAVAGYRMIPVWDPIRMQILDSTQIDPALSALIRYEKDHSQDRRLLGEINQPSNMRSICIGFGRWTALLPLNRDCSQYRPEELAGQNFEFSGTSYEWPTEPSFGIP
jgi:hypothetical protein